MRIAIFTEVFLPKVDGVVTRVTKHVEQLVSAGHDVIIFTPGTPPATFLGCEVVRIASVPFWPVYPEIAVGFATPKIFSKLRAFRPDIVHVVNPMWSAAFGIAAARLQRYPLVASFHTDVPAYTKKLGIGWLAPLSRAALRWFHSQASFNLVTSAPMFDTARSYGIENVKLWPKAVDTQGFRPEARCDTTRSLLSGGKPAAPLVIYVGRVSAEKSVERCFPIMQRVREELPDARLAIIGEGPQYEQLRNNHREEWVHFTGYLAGEALQRAYASGDVLLFPSTTETLGFATLESFASGVPVVGARAGGIPYVIDDGVTGLLVDPQASDTAWARAVSSLLSDPARRGEMARAARTEACKWSWAASSQAVVEIYEQATVTG